jgi:alpha-amylase
MTKPFRRLVAALAASSLAVLGLTSCAPSYPAATPITTEMVGLQLHAWSFDSIAAECPTLQDIGYDWVLVSPPQEPIMGSEWWAHYQPVSYKIDSSFGNMAQFDNMVSVCKANNVQIMVDVVLNHMTGLQNGTGFAGTEFSKYEFPGLYKGEDFNICPTGVSQIEDYSNVEEIQQCELLGLSDLNTGKSNVRDQLVKFLRELRTMGVSGFRIDAAKHIKASELKQIVEQLPGDTTFISEVIGDTPPQSEYYEFGHVFSFDWINQMRAIFGSNGLLGGSADQNYFDLLSPSDKTVALVTNHDTERNGGAITYQFGRAFNLASVFTLASTYGKPMMYSSYAFSDTDAGPIAGPDGYQPLAQCVSDPNPDHGVYQDGDWICQHRWPAMKGMIAFHKAVGKSEFTDIWQEGDAYGFGRGKLGFIVFNTGATDVSATIKTSLPAGNYTDRISGGTVTVATDGSLKVDVSSWNAVAIDVKSKQ